MSIYCKTAILINESVNIQLLLTKFAWECYKADEAVKIDNGRFAIDNGMNNVRAIIRNDTSKVITFCCRYECDVPVTEEKIHNFSKAHNLQLIDIDL